MGSGIEMAAFARNVIARHDTRIALPRSPSASFRALVGR